MLLALTALPCLVSLVVLPWYPESPRYLFVNKRDEAAAERGEYYRLTFNDSIKDLIQSMEMKEVNFFIPQGWYDKWGKYCTSREIFFFFFFLNLIIRLSIQEKVSVK